ncbi:unnamed protein product, partial [marine sediment metagenome]
MNFILFIPFSAFLKVIPACPAHPDDPVARLNDEVGQG